MANSGIAPVSNIRLPRRNIVPHTDFGAMMAAPQQWERPGSANQVPSDKLVYRWACDTAYTNQAVMADAWSLNTTLTSTPVTDTTYFVTAGKGIRVAKATNAGAAVHFSRDHRIYNLWQSQAGSVNCSYDGEVTVVDNSGNDWAGVQANDIIGIGAPSAFAAWGTVDSVAGDTLTLAADIGDATSSSASMVFRPLFTLPDWHCQLHMRFRINEVNALTNNVGIKPYIGIGPTNAYRLPDDNYSVRYANQCTGGQVWQGTASTDRNEGWLEASWNLYSAYSSKGTTCDISSTGVSITSVGVRLEGTHALDLTVDEIWITRSQRLVQRTWDGSAETLTQKGAIVLMLDDTMAGATSAADGKNSLAWAALLEARGMRGVFPVMVANVGYAFSSPTIFSADWDALAQLSQTGHELIIHDSPSYADKSEGWVEDRIKFLLNEWYDKAPRYGVHNYKKGARFFLSPANYMPAAAIKVWERYFLMWMAQERYGAIWVAGGADHAGEDDNLSCPWHNMWPRCDGSLQRLNFSAAWTDNDDDIDAAMADVDTMGGVMLFYGHRCGTGSDITGYTEETITNWTDILDQMYAQSYRTATLSQLYDELLPRELVWKG